jgi:hypothetical protein
LLDTLTGSRTPPIAGELPVLHHLSSAERDATKGETTEEEEEITSFQPHQAY